MKGPTHFLTLNAKNGTSHATPLRQVENKPPAKAKPAACGCGRCGSARKRTPPARQVEPLDREGTVLLARRLGEEAAEAERAGNMDRARELRGRELLCLDLEKVHDREEARKAGTLAEVRQRRRPGILTAPGVPSVLDR